MYAIKTNIKAVKSELTGVIHNQLPFATSHAMNKTLWATRTELMRIMDRYIEGGATDFTKKGIQVIKTTKRNLTGVLQFKGDRFYMRELIYGGTKPARNKRLAHPIMGNKPPLTQRGNIRRGWQQKAKASKSYFVGVPSWGRNNSRLLGVWRRPRSKKGKLELVISYAQSSRVQRPVFPANELGQAIFWWRFQRQLPVSLRLAMRTRKK